MSIKRQLFYYLLLVVFFTFIPLFLIPVFSNKTKVEVAKRETDYKAHLLMREMSASLYSNQYLAESLAFFFENYQGEITRELVEKTISNALLEPEFVSAYGSTIAFVPGETGLGNYSPYFHRDTGNKEGGLLYVELSNAQYKYTSTDWYNLSVKAAGASVWTAPYEDSFGGQALMITYSVPIKKEGRIIAFATVDILIDKLKDLLRPQTALKDGVYSFIITKEHKAIAFPNDDKSFGEYRGAVTLFDKYVEKHGDKNYQILLTAMDDWNRIVEANAVKPKHLQKTISELCDEFYENEKYDYIFTYDNFLGSKSIYSLIPIYSPDSLMVVVVSDAVFSAQYKSLQLFLITAFVLIFVFLLLLTFFLSRDAANPFESLVKQAEQFSGGNLAYRIDLNDKSLSGNLFKRPSREMVKLAGALNDMGDRLKESFDELDSTRREILLRLVKASEYKDEDTVLHLKRISSYSFLLALKMGFSDSDAKMLMDASTMHDIGKIGIPDNILLKPGKLTPEEFEIMKTHSAVGASILSEGESEILQMAERIALGHHEKWNGQGYPSGIAGEKIPLEARIISVCDIFDALVSKRPYKEPWPFDDAVEYIKKESGVSLDPGVVKVFLDSLEEIRTINKRFSEE